MKTLVVTSMQEMSQVLGVSPNSCSEQTNLDNIDDFGDVSFNLNEATVPKLPERDFNIATLTPEKLDELRKSGK